MATLTATELTELRQAMARGQPVVTWMKPQVNAAMQALEDWYEANKASAAQAMEAAAPGMFNAAQKKRIAAFWFRQKFRREGVQ